MHHQSEPPQISPTSTDHHQRSTYFHLLAISRLVNPGLSTAPSIFRPPSPFPHSRVFPNMELRGAASSKGSPDTRSILTSTMAKISTGTSSPRKSSFLQLHSIPPPLRPLVRAYLLGYASAVLPRLLTLVLQHLSNRKRKTPNYALPERDENTFLESAKHVLKTGLDPCRFPTFCAALVGGATLLQVRRHFISLLQKHLTSFINLDSQTILASHTPRFTPHLYPNYHLETPIPVLVLPSFTTPPQT